MAPTGETRTWRLLALVGLATAVAVLSSPEALINPIGEWILHHDGFSGAPLSIASLAQVLLVPLVAVLSDRVHVAGGRRRGWLLLSALAAGACWWKFDPAGTSGISTPIGTAVLLFLAPAVLAIAGGLAVAVALPAARTGAAAAIGRVGVYGAYVAAAVLRPLLDERGTQATTRLIAGTFALLAVAAVVLGKEGPPPTSRSYDTKVRSRGFWGCVLILLWIEGLGHISTFAFGARGAASAAAPAGLVPALALLVACVYFALARSMTPRRLPTLAFALGVACTVATIGRAVLPFPMAQVTAPLLGGAAWLPAVDVGMRFVRRESAAFGFWWLLAVPRFVSSVVAMPLLMRLGPPPVPVSVVAYLSLGLLVVGAFGWRVSERAVVAAP